MVLPWVLMQAVVAWSPSVSLLGWVVSALSQVLASPSCTPGGRTRRRGYGDGTRWEASSHPALRSAGSSPTTGRLVLSPVSRQCFRSVCALPLPSHPAGPQCWLRPSLVVVLKRCALGAHFLRHRPSFW